MPFVNPFVVILLPVLAKRIRGCRPMVGKKKSLLLWMMGPIWEHRDNERYMTQRTRVQDYQVSSPGLNSELLTSMHLTHIGDAEGSTCMII